MTKIKQKKNRFHIQFSLIFIPNIFHFSMPLCVQHNRIINIHAVADIMTRTLVNFVAFTLVYNQITDPPYTSHISFLRFDFKLLVFVRKYYGMRVLYQHDDGGKKKEKRKEIGKENDILVAARLSLVFQFRMKRNTVHGFTVSR